MHKYILKSNELKYTIMILYIVYKILLSISDFRINKCHHKKIRIYYVLPVISNIKDAKAFSKILYVLWCDPLKKLYVLVGMESAHIMSRRSVWSINL